MNKHLSVLAGALALGLPPLVTAQATADDPTHAQHAAPALRYDSAFADYKPWQDTKPGDWRAVNALLKDAPQAGGHAGHGSAAPATKPSAEPARSPSPAKPAPAGPAERSQGHDAHGPGSHK